MWVRSQDKINLMNNPLRIYIIKSNKTISDFEIKGNTYDECICLGIYKSRERALEILDEIQYKIQCLNDDFYYEHVEFVKNKSYTGYKKQHKDIVYQMPKE